MIDSAVPQFTPLLMSNPGDGFDPADPWYRELDPSQQGLAFSRRYGFVMDPQTDLLPAGTQIWLRNLSASAGISFFRYSSSAPKAFDPIFGANGTTNALSWSGLMFHPTVTALPGTNAYSATCQAYLLDVTTGLEAPGSSSNPFVWNWTDLPDGRPTLSLASRLVVFYPAAAAAQWALEGADSLDSGVWTPVTNAPMALEGRTAVVLPASETRSFFRMRLIP